MMPATLISTTTMEAPSRFHVSNEKMAEEMALIEAAKKDPSRFEVIYTRYHEQIFRYAYQRVDDKDLCFDIAQQVFLKALTNLHKFEFRGVPFSSWLYRIAQSEVYQALRDKQVERSVNVDDTDLFDLAEEMKLEKLEKEEMMNRVAEKLTELEEDELLLVEMRFMEKRPFKEVGEILNITENNAKVKMYRVLEKLKKMLDVE